MSDQRRSRFVQPLERVLPLSDGDTITVRRRLSAGEHMEMLERLYVSASGGNGHGTGRIQLNPIQTGIAIVMAYLLDWSFVDADGEPMLIRGEPFAILEAAVRQLEQDDFQEVKDAIERHDAEMTAERLRQKKVPTGDSGSSATSDSPSGAAGASSGSAS